MQGLRVDRPSPANSVISCAAASRNACGQSSSAGSGQSAAQITARHAASGRRAHQMCSVEMCPCRIDFSRRACARDALDGQVDFDETLGIVSSCLFPGLEEDVQVFQQSTQRLVGRLQSSQIHRLDEWLRVFDAAQ